MADALGIAYIAGPVSNRPNGNREAFADAQAQLEALGWQVINPTLNRGSRSAESEATELGERYEYGPLYRRLMRHCFRQVLMADMVVLLDGWQQSKGATREAFLASASAIPLYDFATRNRLTPDFELAVFLA